MSGRILNWTLVFTTPSLEHLAERGFDDANISDSVFGKWGSVRVRRVGTGNRERWILVAPLDDGRLCTFVFRRAEPRDLDQPGAFVVPADGVPADPRAFGESMRLCVSSRVSSDDEVRSYDNWLGKKGGR